MSNLPDFKELKNRVDKVSSELEVLTRQKSVLQEALRDIEKAAASLSKDKPAAAADNKAANAVLKVLEAKYSMNVHNNERKIVEKAFMDYGEKIEEKRRNIRKYRTLMQEATVAEAEAKAKLEIAEQDFKAAKAALAGFSADIKAQAANVKKLAADGQRAADGGMDDEALILAAELQDAWKRLKGQLANGGDSLSNRLIAAQGAYTAAATAAQSASENLLVNTGLLNKETGELEQLTNQQAMRDEIKKQLADNASTPPATGKGVLFSLDSDALLMPYFVDEPPEDEPSTESTGAQQYHAPGAKAATKRKGDAAENSADLVLDPAEDGD